MEAEIKQIIEKNLPAQVGDVLKERLKKAEEDASKIIQLQQTLQQRDSTIAGLEKKIEEYKKFDDRNSALEAREKSCDQTERDQRIRHLDYMLQSEKDKTEFAKSVALGLVRNTEYKRTLFDSKSGPCGVDQYGNTRYETHTVNAEEKKTAE